jgi:dsRNA-specific ribonuclease
VVVGDEVIAQGVGRTKKDAEQEGAKRALDTLSS